MAMTEEFLTVAEVAHHLRRSPDTVLRAIRNGRLFARRIGEVKWLISREDFNKWFEEGAPTNPKEMAG